ncbi:peptidylprolyl isomerase [Candidatus Halobeggiatoa sp. HSG11]|nr:peptidylprolyl isomerase [Candidatus Halobeggiatoa sp. HSG11]
MFIRTGLLSCILLISLNGYADVDAIAVVNGKPITQQAYDDYAKTRKGGNEVDPKKLIDELVQRELLTQDAIKEKLEQLPEFTEKLEETKSRLLMAMAIRNYLDKNPLTDAKLKQEYDKQLKDAVAPNEYQVRHIQLETEAEAQAIIKELENDKDFATIAKDKSTDAGSANQGGELGWISQSITEPEFWSAIEKLEKGKYATAKSRFGWHVIQLNDVRAIELPKFEEVKERIRNAMQSQQMQDYVNQLLKNAKVEIIKK